MPIYEYSCPKCGRRLEELVSSMDVKPPKCPDCNLVMKKQLSASNFHLKGTGWYETDYGKKSKVKSGKPKKERKK